MQEYKVIVNEGSSTFQVMVNEALEEDWELRGDTFTRGSTYTGHDQLCQAMIRRKEKEKNYVDS